MLTPVFNIFIAIFINLIIIFFKIIGRKKSMLFCSYFFRLIGPKTKFNDIAQINLKYIWPYIKKNEIDQICIKMWENLGKNIGEFSFLHNYDPINCKNTKVEGFNYAKSVVLKNKKNNKGIIFFSAHFGNWEIGPYIINKLNTELMGIYRKSNNAYLDRLIQKYRNKKTTYVPKGDLGAKKSFLWLRKGKGLALLMDQKLNEGININFLGKPTKTASAIAELAIRMDLDIIPVKLQRTDNNGHKITFFEKISYRNQNLKHKNKVKYILKQINNHLSSWIKENPEQWLWIHRRWSKSLYKKNRI
jgi:KDO2-lipid IV(A) lauroyltransferase